MNGIIVNSCLTCGWQRKEEPRFIKKCIVCRKELSGKSKKYCSKICNSQIYNKMIYKNQYEKMKNEARLKFLTLNSSKEAVILAQKMNLI